MRQTDEIVSHDAIVVGGGHNALTTAAYLARAGLDVCVLERRDVLGGACVTEELWPGYRVSRASYVVSMLQPKVVADLRLREHGYEPIPLDPAYATVADGVPVFFHEGVVIEFGVGAVDAIDLAFLSRRQNLLWI